MTAKEAKIISDKNRAIQISEQWDNIMNIINTASDCGDYDTLCHSFVYKENEQRLIDNGYTIKDVLHYKAISWNEFKTTDAK